MPAAAIKVDRAVARRGAAAAEEMAGGFFIARVMSPAAMEAAAAARPRRVRRLSAEDDKENIPPVGGSARRRKSPLPAWYPRTPLRDITYIVNALEARRARIRAARVQQMHSSTDEPLLAIPPSQGSIPPGQCCSADASETLPSSSTAAGITSPALTPSKLQQMHSSTDEPLLAIPPFRGSIPPGQCCSVDASETLPSSSTAAGITSPASTQSKLQTSSTSACTSTSRALPTASVVANLAPPSLKLSEPLQMLCSSMDEIERAAKDYLKKTPKGPAKKTIQRRTLMSMR